MLSGITRKNPMSATRVLAILLPFFSLLVPLSSFAAINASQTMVIQTGATERARINTNGIETTRVSATYISTTLVQASGTPTANNHLATKAYVDAAVAAAGGGRPTYMGATGSSYDGSLGGGTIMGVQRGNALCNAAYSGSRMLLSSDIAKTDFTTPISVSLGWVHCDILNGSGTSYECNGFTNVPFAATPNCKSSSTTESWDTNSATPYGMSLSNVHRTYRTTCNTLIPIHCVKD